MKNEVKIIIGIAVVAVAILVLGAFVFSKNTTSSTPAISEEVVSKELLVTPTSRKIGPSDAKVTIVEFADFECPACAYAHPITKKIIAEYGDKIQYVYRNYPLHFNSYPAINAVEAAGEQGKYWEMSDLLFTKQSEWGQKQVSVKDTLTGYAKELSLDIDAFTKVLDDAKYDDLVDADKKDGESAGVSGTPTFFINGKKINSGVPSYESLKALIDAELTGITVTAGEITTEPVIEPTQ